MKKILSAALAALTAFMVLASAVSFKPEDVKSESRMSLGYSIINGYSKLSVKNGLKSYKKAAVYSSLDLGNPYIIALAGTFYLTQGVDLERAITDNDYSYSLAEELNGFMKAMFVKNERGEALKQQLETNGVRIIRSFDSVGLYIVETDTDTAEMLMNDEKVDFVFAGGEVPDTMKDLNLDGKSDAADGEIIQRLLAHDIEFNDKDEKEYLKFAADINGDKKLNIFDVTSAQRAGG